MVKISDINRTLFQDNEFSLKELVEKNKFNHLLDRKEYQCKYKNYTFLVQDNRIYIVQAIGKNDLFELIEEEAKFLLDTSIDNLKEV